MSIIRILNCPTGGKMLINLTKISYAQLKDKTITLHFNNKDDIKLNIKCDTIDEAEKYLKDIQKDLNKTN